MIVLAAHKKRRIIGRNRHQPTSRASSICFSIVFCILSHCVCNTLQCMSSHSRSKSQGMSNEDYNSSPDENEDQRQISGSDKSSKQNTLSLDPADQPTFQFCLGRLTKELNIICKGQFPDYDPDLEYVNSMRRPRSPGQTILPTGQGTYVKRGLRRVPRSLVDECCKQACSPRHVRKYCKTRNEPSSELETESGHDGKNSSMSGEATSQRQNQTETEEESPEETTNSQKKLQYSDEAGFNSNAYSSTMPSQIISLGDYDDYQFK